MGIFFNSPRVSEVQPGLKNWEVEGNKREPQSRLGPGASEEVSRGLWLGVATGTLGVLSWPNEM